jgi:hypothetical protein
LNESLKEQQEVKYAEGMILRCYILYSQATHRKAIILMLFPFILVSQDVANLQKICDQAKQLVAVEQRNYDMLECEQKSVRKDTLREQESIRSLDAKLDQLKRDYFQRVDFVRATFEETRAQLLAYASNVTCELFFWELVLDLETGAFDFIFIFSFKLMPM